MRLTCTALFIAITGGTTLSVASQAGAEQDFRPIWCPQATSYYVQLREALDPLRIATVGHDLDVAKLQRQGKKPAATKPAPRINTDPEQPPFTEEDNPLRPRFSQPAHLREPHEEPAPLTASTIAPAIQWNWDDETVQDAVAQFDEKSPLLYRRINSMAAMTWWAELQDEGAELGERFAGLVGDIHEEVSSQDLTKDWISLEEQYETVKNLCLGWGETVKPGGHPPGQAEWPEGTTPDTARPPGIENTAWPHTPGWEDIPVPGSDDPDAPPITPRPYPPAADTSPKPLAHQGCERYDYRSGGWGQYPFCPGEGPDDSDDSDDEE